MKCVLRALVIVSLFMLSTAYAQSEDDPNGIQSDNLTEESAEVRPAPIKKTSKRKAGRSKKSEAADSAPEELAGNKSNWHSISIKNAYSFRASILYQGGETAVLHPPFDSYAPKGVMVEWDFLFFHLGLNHQFDQDISIGGVRYEAYMSNLDMGFRMHAPFRYVQPFLGLGGHLGWMAVSSPSYRKENGILAHWEGSRSGTWGSYYEAGLDLVVPVGREFAIGARATFRNSKIQSGSLGEFNGESLNATRWIPMFGIVFASGSVEGLEK